MLLLKQEGMRCTVTALAMVMGLPVQRVIDCLGKTGEPGQEIHIQEIMTFCLDRGYALYEVEYDPQLPDGAVYGACYARSRFWNILQDRRALVYVQGHTCRHMLAWSGQYLIDPAIGAEVARDAYYIYSAYIIGRLSK